jgi:hypothetical protein
LKRFNRLAVGRELRMIELKGEVNGLLGELNRGQKYRTAREMAPASVPAAADNRRQEGE